MADPLFGLTPINAGAALAPSLSTTGTGLTTAAARAVASGETLTSVYAMGATDTQILTADSTQASGLKWATGATLNSQAASLGSDVALSAGTLTGLFTTTLTVGTWLIAFSAEIINGGAAAGDAQLIIGTGTGAGTFDGPIAADGELPALTGGSVGLAFTTRLTVTAGGTFAMYAQSVVAATAKAVATTGTGGKVTGFIACKIA